jgi:hypothetical protein
VHPIDPAEEILRCAQAKKSFSEKENWTAGMILNALPVRQKDSDLKQLPTCLVAALLSLDPFLACCCPFPTGLSLSHSLCPPYSTQDPSPFTVYPNARILCLNYCSPTHTYLSFLFRAASILLLSDFTLQTSCSTDD